jgi:hypothetical protein
MALIVDPASGITSWFTSEQEHTKFSYSSTLIERTLNFLDTVSPLVPANRLPEENEPCKNRTEVGVSTHV